MAATAPVARPWTDEQLVGAPKKQIIEFLQKHANNKFLGAHHLHGAAANVAKGVKKEDLDAAYKFARQYRTPADDKESAEIAAKKGASAPAKPAQPEKGYTKTVTKKGDDTTSVNRGDTVSVRYTGTLPDGKVFDSNAGKSDPPLKFKVGQGKVIRGWDEGLVGMAVGETARIVIEPSWAYGKKGMPDGKVPIPPNTRLTFEVELISID